MGYGGESSRSSRISLTIARRELEGGKKESHDPVAPERVKSLGSGTARTLPRTRDQGTAAFELNRGRFENQIPRGTSTPSA